MIHAEENPTFIYRLVRGKVKQYDISYQGDEVVLNQFQPPAYFLMPYAVTRTPNTYFFEADTDVELQQAPIDMTISFVKSNPDVLYDLLSRVYRGTDGLLGRMTHLMASGAKGRPLYELIIECRRFGTKNDAEYAIAVSEHDLAIRTGLTRETINREMRKLKGDGLVSVTPTAICITDLDRLVDLLQRDL